MPTIYAGTSGWAYPSWKPEFYPPKLASAKFLGYYATRLNSVELNYTFRRFPTEKLLAAWIAATPANFKFAVKANQAITHIKRLKDAAETTEKFITSLRPLAEAQKLGPVLFQLPPFLKCDLSRLQEFLAALPKGFRPVFEFRHESWFREDVFAVLRNANAGLCQAESEKLEAPDIQTANFSYLRLRKEAYSAGDLKSITNRAHAAQAHGDVFVYFKHEDTPEGAFYAEKLLSGARLA